MIPKTEVEKQKLKEAKLKYSKAMREDKLKRIEASKMQTVKPKHSFNMDGILPEEEILPDTYPVHWDFLYIVDDNGGKVVRSDVAGTVATLKRDLRSRGYKAENIYSCDHSKRWTLK